MSFDWRGIDSAPKDGTWILAINNRCDCAIILWSDDALYRGARCQGWVHPYSNGERSPFWNGADGCGPVAWCLIPRGEAAREIVERFSR
ncbi:hypothetical protein FHR71_000905 [Methylobacterium sp. RAS18]|nr:hypothetical protein [Methylobacterium sp. RAS18]